MADARTCTCTCTRMCNMHKCTRTHAEAAEARARAHVQRASRVHAMLWCVLRYILWCAWVHAVVHAVCTCHAVHAVVHTVLHPAAHPRVPRLLQVERVLALHPRRVELGSAALTPRSHGLPAAPRAAPSCVAERTPRVRAAQRCATRVVQHEALQRRAHLQRRHQLVSGNRVGGT